VIEVDNAVASQRAELLRGASRYETIVRPRRAVRKSAGRAPMSRPRRAVRKSGRRVPVSRYVSSTVNEGVVVYVRAGVYGGSWRKPRAAVRRARRRLGSFTRELSKVQKEKQRAALEASALDNHVEDLRAKISSPSSPAAERERSVPKEF
jgi:hypothetical protein